MSAAESETPRAKTAIRNATLADYTPVAQSLARAFYTDPVFGFLVPDESVRLKKLEAIMGLFFKLGLPHGACYTTGNYESITLWRPPNEWDVPFWVYIVNAPRLLATFGGSVFRALSIVDMMEKIHPHEPHWYLQTIGTDPAFQGKGYGGVIMRHTLATADAAHMPCYLESSKDTNIPIYRSFGFELTGEIQIPNGPRIWPMWRKPR